MPEICLLQLVMVKSNTPKNINRMPFFTNFIYFSYLKYLIINSVPFSSSDSTPIYPLLLSIMVLDKDNKNLDPKFTLVGFDNDSQTITVGEIPANETIVGKEKKLSAKGHFEYGGARYLRDARTLSERCRTWFMMKRRRKRLTPKPTTS